MRKEFSNLLIVSMKRIIVFFVIILLHCSCSELNEPEYNNNLDPKSENYFTRKPYNLTITSSTPTSIDLKWSYPTTNYAGFNFEFSEDLGHFSVLQKLDKKFYSIDGLDTSLSYYFRINAFYEDINTEYSDTLYAKYFNIPTYNISRSRYFLDDPPKHMVAISPDDELCILVGSATEIKRQNLNFKNVKTFEYTIDDIIDIQFSSEQNHIVFLKSNSNIEIYDSKSFKLLKSIVRTNVSNISTEFNSDQIYFIEHDSIFTFRANDIDNNINTLKLDSKNLENILISSTTIYVLIQESNAIKIYDKSSKSIVLTISEDVDNITCMDFSLDDANFIYSNHNKVFVYDLKSKTKIYTYTGIYNQTIDQVKFLRSSNYFIYSTLGELFLKSVSNSSSIIELYQSSMPIYHLKQDQARENFIISGSPAAIFTVDFISKGSWRKTAI